MQRRFSLGRFSSSPNSHSSLAGKEQSFSDKTCSDMTSSSSSSPTISEKEESLSNGTPDATFPNLGSSEHGHSGETIDYGYGDTGDNSHASSAKSKAQLSSKTQAMLDLIRDIDENQKRMAAAALHVPVPQFPELSTSRPMRTRRASMSAYSGELGSASSDSYSVAPSKSTTRDPLSSSSHHKTSRTSSLSFSLSRRRSSNGTTEPQVIPESTDSERPPMINSSYRSMSIRNLGRKGRKARRASMGSAVPVPPPPPPQETLATESGSTNQPKETSEFLYVF